jgi:hypothetical protein
VLLGKLDRDLLENFSVVALQGCEQSTITVDDDETELLVVMQQALKR